MRYRILAPGYLNSSFRLISTLFIDDKTGEERDIPWRGTDEVFSLQVETGTVVEIMPDTNARKPFLPAPWMEPLDDEAKALCEQYPDAYAPSELATIDSLALHGQALQDRESYRNEGGVGPSKAPIYPKGVQNRLADRPGAPAPRLPSLGKQPGAR